MSRQKQLRRARKIRSSISAERRALKLGRIALTDVLGNPERFSLGRCKVFDVLKSAPGLSDKGAKKILLMEKIWPLDRLQDLSLMQREDIINALPPRARNR